jgi:hypothetical protein
VHQVDARVQRGLDVLVHHARQSADGGVGRVGDVADGLELRVGVHGEARLDDVGAHVVEHRRYLPFVLVRERRPRRLLAVA